MADSIFLLHCSRRWYQNKTPALTKQTDFGSTALDIRRHFADINTYFSFASLPVALFISDEQQKSFAKEYVQASSSAEPHHFLTTPATWADLKKKKTKLI